MATRLAVLCVALAGCTFGGSGVGGSLASGTGTNGTAGEDGDGDGGPQSQTGQTPGDSGGMSASVDGTSGSVETGGDPTTGGERTALGTDTGDASESEDSSEDSEDSGAACDPPTTTACLVNPGLLARYYLDEAGGGAAMGMVEDSASEPVDLQIDPDQNIAYTTVRGHRGLEWFDVGGDGVAQAAVPGTKFAQLHGATTVTYELVVDLDGGEGGARVIHFGSGSEGGLLTLRLDAIDDLRFVWQHEAPEGNWGHDFSNGRVVVHFVLDTNEVDGDDRRRLYINGVLLAAAGGGVPDPGETITADGGGVRFALGNRANGSRAIDGILFYAAIYTGALDDETIAANAEVLLVSDDRP